MKWVDAPVKERTATTRTTGSGTSTAPAQTQTTTTTTAANDRDAHRYYPDHAVVNMTKDQLKALPEVRYSR